MTLPSLVAVPQAAALPHFIAENLCQANEESAKFKIWGEYIMSSFCPTPEREFGWLLIV
jgi:hypothetical protein